jgi:hypothetical protein
MGGGHRPKYVRSPIPSGGTTNEDPFPEESDSLRPGRVGPSGGRNGRRASGLPPGAGAQGPGDSGRPAPPRPAQHNQTDDMARAQRHGFAPRGLRLALAGRSSGRGVLAATLRAASTARCVRWSRRSSRPRCRWSSTSPPTALAPPRQGCSSRRPRMSLQWRRRPTSGRPPQFGTKPRQGGPPRGRCQESARRWRV